MYLEAILKERFSEEKMVFGFSIEPNLKAVGNAWVITIKCLFPKSEKKTVHYQVKSQDRIRGFDLLIKLVLDDQQTRVK